MAVNTTKLEYFRKNLRKLRKQQNLTQEELASKVRVSPTYIGFIEQGQRDPTIQTADKIARALGVSLSDLFD